MSAHAETRRRFFSTVSSSTTTSASSGPRGSLGRKLTVPGGWRKDSRRLLLTGDHEARGIDDGIIDMAEGDSE